MVPTGIKAVALALIVYTIKGLSWANMVLVLVLPSLFVYLLFKYLEYVFRDRPLYDGTHDITSNLRYNKPTLRIRGKQLALISPLIETMDHLRTIVFTDNILSSNSFNNQKTGEVLDLSQLQNLANIDMSHNVFVDIPVSLISVAPNITRLILHTNQIRYIDEQIFLHFYNLNTLSLKNNRLTKIPTSINMLQNLRVLDISNNMISSIPSLIGKMNSLYQLNLSKNYITHIPESISGMQNLARLYLDRNKIQTIPCQMGLLDSISSFTISHNKIEVIPEQLGELVNLRTLDLSFNKIVEVPPFIGNIRSLSTLKLGGNMITFIPESIADCSDIKELHVQYNLLLVALPSLKQCKHLKRINIKGTGISYGGLLLSDFQRGRIHVEY
eukprot:TRINITY_DN5098_c0_g1_i1.p1 TRINITY_DN5098_c0_g1~~TRINITY_DN5098_c0_g1_i1.p1  ORF type:complete len:385 (-),score=33.81 TRINITY_DN5098_c0_g1_i1:13-1167(-)